VPTEALLHDSPPLLQFSDSLSDEDLVVRVRAGDVRLFELLMRRYNARVYRAVRAILRDENEAEDVMQEAYVNAYAHLGDFSGRARFSTWLTRIAVHEAFARLRRRRRVDSLEDSSDEVHPMAAPISDPEQRASDSELRKILEDAIDVLPEGFRTVFVLRAVEQLSVRETADILDIPEETVKTRLHRARSTLQKHLVERAGAALPAVFGFHLARCDRIVTRVLDRIRPRG